MYLRNDEKVIYSLRDLYRGYGYQHYKVTKFEEYDLYVRNKSFLVSENMLTFTDTNGKLMALKPDITLSIVKNARPKAGDVDKVYYCENVYRTSTDYNGFHEITQTGLECIGALDDYTVCEVIMLACRSLAAISEKYLLQVSHVGFVDALLGSVEESQRNEIISLIRAKNVPALKDYCAGAGIADTLGEKFVLLADTFGTLHEVLPTLKILVDCDQTKAAYDQLKGIDEAMAAYGLSDKVYVDFSVISDLNYYNGIVFQGYVDGLSSHILSGGRYDRLVKKMGKQCGGIGFAVYVSMLERFWPTEETFDADVLLVYDKASTPIQIAQAVEALEKDGRSVKAVGQNTGALRCREILTLKEGGLVW